MALPLRKRTCPCFILSIIGIFLPIPLAAAMFCQQCEQTEFGKGCTTVGVCGKTPEVRLDFGVTSGIQQGLKIQVATSTTCDPLGQ